MIRRKKHLAAATPFTMEELKASISKMRRKGAPGPDDIIPAFLKELGPSALSELLAICNQSLISAECPQNWKNATIIPLLKATKPPSDIASYRPVSLTSIVCKTMEKIVRDHILDHLKSNKLLSDKQYGFISGRSTKLPFNC